MKKIMFILSCLMLGFVVLGCQNNNSKTTTSTTSTTKAVEEVRIEVDYRQEEIAFYNAKYEPRYLYVELIYSNGIKLDVTYECSYTLDTSKVGDVEGYVTYSKFSAPIKAKVIVPTINGIRLMKNDEYREFNIGDTYDTNNIYLIASYSDGSTGRIMSFDYGIFYADGTEIDKSKPFDKSGVYQVVFTLINSGIKYETMYDIYVNPLPEENVVTFEIEDNLLDVNTNCYFQEFMYADIFSSDYVDIAAVGEKNGIRDEIDGEIVCGVYQGREYRLCINLASPSVSSTRDSLRFDVKTDIELEMVVNTQSDDMPYLSKDALRTADVEFTGSIGKELSVIKTTLTTGTYYLGHGLSWLNIYEIKVKAI